MATLGDQAGDYLRAEGYAVTVVENDELLGRRPTVGGGDELIHVWWRDNLGGDFRFEEAAYRRRFVAAAEAEVSSLRFFLVPTTEGISREFRQGARRYEGVSIRVPIQFFDTSFKWEESEDATSALRTLREEGAALAYRRTPQPFIELTGESKGDDLLPHLAELVRQPSSTTRSILVVGPAGSGKSYLYSVLFADLYDAFIKSKQLQEVAPRPIPLRSQSLRFEEDRTMRSILRTFLRTEFARPLDEEVLSWRLLNGWASWLIDGLDEVIANDASFFDDLGALISSPPTGQPRYPVVTCVRDSLFESSGELQRFLQEFSDQVSVLRLERWGAASKRSHAVLRLGARAEDFLGRLRERRGIDDLASNAFYCSLLVDQYRLQPDELASDEGALLEDALSRLIEREYGKELLQRNIVDGAAVVDFLAALAAEDLQGGFRGVALATVRELAQLTLPSDLPEREASQLVENMTHLAVFSASAAPWQRSSGGRLEFSQEVMEHFLIGKYVAATLETHIAAVIATLSGAQLPSDSVAFRVVASSIAPQRLSQILTRAIETPGLHPIAYKNLVQLAARSAVATEILRSIHLENRDLGGIRLADLDLSGISFRGADLTEAVLDGSVLQACEFEDAILAGTSLRRLPAGSLAGASFGGLARFIAVIVGPGRLLDRPEAIRAWLAKETATSTDEPYPCPTAMQLRFIFNKFVLPNGTARRSWLDRRGTLRGKRYVDPEPVLDAAVRQGLLELGDRDHVRRPEGDDYAELVAYATSLAATPRIVLLLDQVCPRPNCRHVPREDRAVA